MHLATKGVVAILDGRNYWHPATVKEAGVAYMGVGRGMT
jgi:hypothetical protein